MVESHVPDLSFLCHMPSSLTVAMPPSPPLRYPELNFTCDLGVFVFDSSTLN